MIDSKTNNMEKIINGWWDGQPIWREKTAGEVLSDLLDEAQNRNLVNATSEHDEILSDKEEADYESII